MNMVRKGTCYLKERDNTPRRTVKGLIIYCANSVASSQIQKFDWTDALVDAAIISGLTFFSTLGGGSVAGLEGLSIFKAAAVATLAQFFIFLALKRGIVQPNKSRFNNSPQSLQ